MEAKFSLLFTIHIWDKIPDKEGIVPLGQPMETHRVLSRDLLVHHRSKQQFIPAYAARGIWQSVIQTETWRSEEAPSNCTGIKVGITANLSSESSACARNLQCGSLEGVWCCRRPDTRAQLSLRLQVFPQSAVTVQTNLWCRNSINHAFKIGKRGRWR